MKLNKDQGSRAVVERTSLVISIQITEATAQSRRAAPQKPELKCACQDSSLGGGLKWKVEGKLGTLVIALVLEHYMPETHLGRSL